MEREIIMTTSCVILSLSFNGLTNDVLRDKNAKKPYFISTQRCDISGTKLYILQPFK